MPQRGELGSAGPLHEVRFSRQAVCSGSTSTSQFSDCPLERSAAIPSSASGGPVDSPAAWLAGSSYVVIVHRFHGLNFRARRGRFLASLIATDGVVLDIHKACWSRNSSCIAVSTRRTFAPIPPRWSLISIETLRFSRALPVSPREASTKFQTLLHHCHRRIASQGNWNRKSTDFFAIS
jgi:hypothetical protein